jgi:NAD(P)H-dependent FMN reductase
MSILIIKGSKRETSIGNKHADHLATRYETIAYEIPDYLCVLRKPFHAYRPDEIVPPEIADAKRRLDIAKTVVLFVPEYNHACSPSILSFVNHFFHETWEKKRVIVVAYGGQETGGQYASAMLKETLDELKCESSSVVVNNVYRQTSDFFTWIEDDVLFHIHNQQ